MVHDSFHEYNVICAAQDGDQSAMRALVVHYTPHLHKHLYYMLRPSGREAQCEDLLQETFLRAFKALSRYDTNRPEPFISWLYCIASRVALSELRKSKPTLTTIRDDASATHQRNPYTKLELCDALAQLEAQERACVLLHMVHGLSYNEIAHELSLGLGTLKSKLSRARSKLRNQLTPPSETITRNL